MAVIASYRKNPFSRDVKLLVGGTLCPMNPLPFFPLKGSQRVVEMGT